MPRHSIRTTPASVRKRGNRERVRKCTIALEGGRRAFVDFQVTPPLGSSMVWGQHLTSRRESGDRGTV